MTSEPGGTVHSTSQLPKNIEVTRYRKSDGYVTRYWSVMLDGELLVVTLYRKGAEAVAKVISNLINGT